MLEYFISGIFVLIIISITAYYLLSASPQNNKNTPTVNPIIYPVIENTTTPIL
jgi:uncharacterized protein YpmB